MLQQRSVPLPSPKVSSFAPLVRQYAAPLLKDVRRKFPRELAQIVVAPDGQLAPGPPSRRQRCTPPSGRRWPSRIRPGSTGRGGQATESGRCTRDGVSAAGEKSVEARRAMTALRRPGSPGVVADPSRHSDPTPARVSRASRVVLRQCPWEIARTAALPRRTCSTSGTEAHAMAFGWSR